MAMKYIYVFVLLASQLIFDQIVAQNKRTGPWTISGTVRDENGTPIAGASVYELNKCGTTTDTSGHYILVCDTRPLAITTRYFGYFARQLKIEDADFQQNRAYKNIEMLSQTPVLKEVTITAKPIEIIVEEDFTKDLYDFGFANEYLLLLLREKKQYYLRLVTEQGETISQLRLPEMCRTLHRSCLGDFHAVGEQHVWEVVLGPNKVDTMMRYQVSDFKRFIEPCVQSVENQYFFRKYGLLNQSVTYTVYEQNKTPQKVIEITNERGLSNAEGAIGDFLTGKPFVWRTPERQGGMTNVDISGMIAQDGQSDPYTSENLVTHVCHSCYDQLYRLSELENIRSDSVYAPLLKIKDTLCLFDHVNGKLMRFSPKVAQQEVIPIRYFLEKSWSKQLIQDDVSQRIYARFAPKEGLQLREINAQSGAVKATYDLTVAPYLAGHFKIRNGILYCLGQSDVTVPNKMLYKMNIFAKRKG
jgi:CarboxypepD_reg-like domain